jgi:hypothetical protein
VLKLCIDQEIFSCERLAVEQPAAAAGESDDGPYAVVGSSSFEALRRAVTLSVPASFGKPTAGAEKLAGESGAAIATPEVDASVTPVSRSRGEYELDQPLAMRTVTGAELPDDPVLLLWAELVEHQRQDGGAAYAQAIADYDAKSEAAKGEGSGGATEAWLGHVMLNDWPSGLSEDPRRTVPYVELERASAPLALRLPATADSELRFSLHSEASGGYLLLASGPPAALIPRCSTVLHQGETQPLDSDALQTLTALAETMAEPGNADDGPPGSESAAAGGAEGAAATEQDAVGEGGGEPTEDEQATQPRVLSFAQRRLDAGDLPPDFSPECDAELESAVTTSALELTLLGLLALSPAAKVRVYHNTLPSPAQPCPAMSIRTLLVGLPRSPRSPCSPL